MENEFGFFTVKATGEWVDVVCVDNEVKKIVCSCTTWVVVIGIINENTIVTGYELVVTKNWKEKNISVCIGDDFWHALYVEASFSQELTQDRQNKYFI